MTKYQGLLDLVGEIKKCERAGATVGALALCFVCIDTMAFLSMPAAKTKQGRSEFIAWTNRYMKADLSQEYQYRGIDVYAARCGLLHAFSAEADLHRSDSSIYVFGYHDGGAHHLYEDRIPKVAAIGTASFFNDLAIAVHTFLSECLINVELRELVSGRLSKVYRVMPLQRESDSTP